MSQLLQHYLNDLQALRRVSGTSRESVVREAFKTLLKDWGKSRDLIFIPEFEFTTLQKNRVYADGEAMRKDSNMKKGKSIRRYRAKSAAPSKTLVVGRKSFAKISEVEGIRLTSEMKKTMAEFDRKKLPHDARRRAIIGKFKRAGE